MLGEGDIAPDFLLPANGGTQFSIGAHQDRIVILYFYPKDDTTGCTREAIEFSAAKGEFARIGAVIVGVSPDPVKKHDKFIAKHDLSVILAADERKGTLSAYGVWAEKSLYGKKYMGVERSTFLIDKQGRIARVWRKVSVPGHVDEVLAAARALAG